MKDTETLTSEINFSENKINSADLEDLQTVEAPAAVVVTLVGGEFIQRYP